MEGVEEALGKPSLERTFEVEPRREELRTVIEELRAAIDRTEELAQSIDKALVARNEALEAYDVTFLRTARIFEEYFLYVGDTEMAKRVRPSSRRPGRTEEVADGTAPDDGTSEPDSGEGEEPSDEPAPPDMIAGTK